MEIPHREIIRHFSPYPILLRFPGKGSSNHFHRQEEQDDGADAVALGKVTLECDEFPHIAKITFLTRGLFTVTVEVYNGDEELLRVFTCQPYVI